MISKRNAAIPAILKSLRKRLLGVIFLNNVYDTYKKWAFSADNFEFVNGFFYYYLNQKKFKKIEYPLIKFRSVFIRNKHVIEFGKNITLAHNCFISPLSLKVGNDCWLGVNNFICGKVKIGNGVILGPNVSIPGATHEIRPGLPFSTSASIVTGTTIKDSVWIGSNVTILDGVTIGKGAVVAANSLVTKDVPPFSVVGGVPAKVLRLILQSSEN